MSAIAAAWRAGAASGAVGTCDDALAAQDDLRKKGLQGFTGTNAIPKECERVLRGGGGLAHVDSETAKARDLRAPAEARQRMEGVAAQHGRSQAQTRRDIKCRAHVEHRLARVDDTSRRRPLDRLVAPTIGHQQETIAMTDQCTANTPATHLRLPSQ